MDRQEQLIEESDWRVLIVLDACRYDTFSDLYSDYFSGTLRKVKSPASCTINWLKTNFTSYYPNTTYVSGSPYVNSRGVSREGWNAIDHFPAEKIRDVWDSGWDPDKGTVPPETMKETAISMIEDSSNKQKIIIHFMQPHAPYLTIDHSYSNREGKQRERSDTEWYKYLKRALGPYFLSVVGMDAIFQIKQQVGLDPTIDGEEMWRELDMGTWQKAYSDNLKEVLRVLPELIDYTDGKVVITADHGEALGEGGLYMHPMGVNAPILREVPWFVIEE